MKQKLQICKKRNRQIIVEEFNDLLLKIDTYRQKISKDIEDLNTTVNQLDLNDIYEIRPTTAEYSFTCKRNTYKDGPYAGL